MQKLIASLSIFIILTYTPLKSVAGEQLRQEFPLPTGEWEVYRTKDGLHSQWYEYNSNESYTTYIIPFEHINYPMEITPELSKKISDKNNKEYCTRSESLVISEISNNGFPTMPWKSTCKLKSDSKGITLSKVIIGIEASYSISKTWISIPSDEDYGIWLKYIISISVCNPESPSHSCPPLTSGSNRSLRSLGLRAAAP